MDIEAFRQMVAKESDGFLGRYGLGDRILQTCENLEEAVERLRVAVQLDPSFRVTYRLAGLISEIY
jgi:hypothetical protein